VVFKGSVFIADFVVNASIPPDFTPFHRAFADSKTFMHHGAYHAVAQFRVRQWEMLHTLLAEALAQDVTQLVITGHSLGGQYALAFLGQLFVEKFAPPPQGQAAVALHPLLDQARVVVFAAPMCFGVAEGDSVRQDLSKFVNERSILYITGGDPIPRLWSEVDLELLVKYLVDYLQGKMTGIQRNVVDFAVGTGGLIKKGQELLQRPDIHKHLVRPAKRYRHLSRIRILDKEFVNWTPMEQESISLDDHSLSGRYIPQFLAAFDPCKPGGLFNQEGKQVVDDGGRPTGL